MKILLVEDNAALAKRIKQQLVEKRYVVDVVESGEDALTRVEAVSYSLIILDLGLPKMGGEAICRKMRAEGVKAPIMILTGTGGVPNKVRLLDNGADDYLTKPFDSVELIARVGALTRRQPATHGSHLIIPPQLEIDIEERRVKREGKDIPLRRKEFDILVYLMQNPGRVVTREMIIQNVWDPRHESHTNAIDVHVKHLRDQLDRPFDYHYIKTEYGLGYRVDIPRDEEKKG